MGASGLHERLDLLYVEYSSDLHDDCARRSGRSPVRLVGFACSNETARYYIFLAMGVTSFTPRVSSGSSRHAHFCNRGLSTSCRLSTLQCLQSFSGDDILAALAHPEPQLL
jgi:hypothetical protein